ncbi:hypothetical protein COY27_01750 [Candidatus Woesearchaeota archaeon CG_4_10_14_0_2_um_filter_33_13]|nr:MAG: hypothetical protein COY27_01750 [Candidatus Woesearchaeota archaeon CG_4_10_14_0_2_um_filter_33_13]
MKKVIGVMFVLLTFLIVGCSSVDEELVCTKDVDCVPNQCCHADGALNKEFGPNCLGQLCTMECVPGTIDCGQGEIKCLNEQCQVVFK